MNRQTVIFSRAAGLLLTLVSVLVTLNSFAETPPFKEDPIHAFGHGAALNKNGEIITLTPDFIEQAQQYYMARVREVLPEHFVKSTEEERTTLFKNRNWNQRTRLYAEALVLESMLSKSEKRIRGEIQGKLALFKSHLKYRTGNTKLTLPEAIRDYENTIRKRLPQTTLSPILPLPESNPDGTSTVLFMSTLSSGAAYLQECENAGVPRPIDWDKDDPRWVKSGTPSSNLSPNFLGGNAKVYYYLPSSAPDGICIALPRDNGGDIYALGIICQGKQTGNTCYWDNQSGDVNYPIGQNEDVPIADFAGGAELEGGGGGVCTACHAGENTYVIHPGSDLASVPNTMPDVWYTPLVHPDWPQNAGPYTGLSEGTGCTSCHTQSYAGRFPKISSEISAYCTYVLDNAVAMTMPPSGSPTAAMIDHTNILQGLCDDAPSPVLRIEEIVLDYGAVELGFSYTKAIVVHNDGDADLTFSIDAPSSATDIDVEQWSSVPETTNYTVAPGDAPAIFKYIYSPDEIAVHTFQVELTSNDGDQAVTLTGEGAAPIPIDTLLVLDRSGSMDESVGERRKIDSMRDAVSLYADLLRDEVGDTGTGDKLGMVKYNDVNSVYENFTEMSAAKRTNLTNDKLSDAALNDINKLKPDDATGIGGAMQTAAFQFGGATPDRRQVMVVLTDGIENREPYIADVVDPIRATFPDLMMYSIGLGENIEPTKLQSITNVTNGYHQVAAVLSDTTLFDLETFYFKIFVNATDMDLVVDPTHVVSLAGTAPVIIDKAAIISSDRSATFLILDDPYMRAFYTLEFVSPKGDVIVPGSTIGGIPIQESSRHTYKIYRIVFPDLAQEDEYVGEWLVRITPNGKWKKYPRNYWDDVLQPSPIQYNSYLSPVHGYAPVGFAAAVASDYKMDVALLPDHFLPGANVLMTATLTDRGWPSVTGTIDVTVTSDAGTNQHLTLYDDGTHGDLVAQDGTWSNHFTQTAFPSVYKFFFQAVGENYRGELAPREDTRYLTLMKPESTPPRGDKDCLPCKLVRILLALGLMLLLWLVYCCCFRKKLG